jgi:hypothetical protein
MTQLERQIRTAQHRLWINQWLHALSLTLAIVASLFAIVVLIQRLFDLPLPIPQIGIGAAVLVLLASIIWTVLTRTDAALAAARLDDAAGLRERLSSGRYCRDAQDPFAAAVVADAEQISQSISARQHIRLHVPKPFGWSVLSVALAAMMFLVSPGLLARSEAKEDQLRTMELEQTKVAVKRQMDSVRQLMQSHPALETMEDKLGELDQQAGGQLRRPSDVRHEAIKKIDKLSDAVKQKRQNDKYQATKDMRKFLRGLKVPKSPDAQTQKLNEALRDGDVKAARKEITRLQEQLATLKMEKDKELVAKLSKQLSDLAKQLEKAAKDEKLEQQLKQAGIKPEDVKKLLENLTKKDLDQLKKTLEEKGLSQQQIEKIAKKLQSKQQTGGMAQKLAQGMKKAAQASAAGQMSSAQAGLSMAADQLSELEQLEQEMNQLDAAMADLDQSKNNLSKPCSSCNGVGCGRCQSGTGGMGRRGQGRGGVAPEQETNVAFKIERGKVNTGKGAIIGQFLFDGEQVKGDVSTGFVDVVTAAEHDASDRINRNRVPRQYHKAVKSYFSNVQRAIRSANLKTPDEGSKPGSDDNTGDSGKK